MRTKSKLETALDDYFDKFGQNYPLVITSCQPDEYHIKAIRKAIAENKPVTVDLREDVVY